MRMSALSSKRLLHIYYHLFLCLVHELSEATFLPVSQSVWLPAGGSFPSLIMSRPKAVPQSSLSAMRKGRRPHQESDMFKQAPRLELVPLRRSQVAVSTTCRHSANHKPLVPDHSNSYLRQQPTAAMQQQQPAMFNQPYQQGAQMMGVAVNQPWGNSNPPVSMETVKISPSVPSSHMTRPTTSRQQQNHGAAYSNNFESQVLPQLSIRDLQCLDTVPQTSDVKSQTLFQMPPQREELIADASSQNQGTQNQAFHTTWPNFTAANPLQSSFNGAVPGGGGASQALGSYQYVDGAEDDDFIKSLVGGTSQGGFTLKQEPQSSRAGPETLAPRENQVSTYIDLLPRTVSNGSHLDPVRQDHSQVLKPSQSPFTHSSMAHQAHYPTLADWIKANRHPE